MTYNELLKLYQEQTQKACSLAREVKHYLLAEVREQNEHAEQCRKAVLKKLSDFTQFSASEQEELNLCNSHPLQTTPEKIALSEQEIENERNAFAEFENAQSGYFNGFDFVNEFHSHYDKCNALEVLEADDCAEVKTSAGAVIHVGADGITVFIMTENAKNGGNVKIVAFNRSAYAF